MKTYTHPKETWDHKECKKRASLRRSGGPKGIVAGSASSYAEYGQTVRFNGGTTHNGEWYEAEHRPLPDIPSEWEFVYVPTWGTVIRRKGA